MPNGVARVRVLAVGGGSGGLSCFFGGGGSGYVRSGEYEVAPGQSVPVTVGRGGEGSTYKGENNNLQDSKAGGTSSFGEVLLAPGGEGRSGRGNWLGTAGGSGGGGGTGCVPGRSTAGGTDGSGGENIGVCISNLGVGPGQGKFISHLLKFIRNRLTPGAGGSGVFVGPLGTPYSAGGGGGGGILINGYGPTASPGMSSYSGGKGGSGYGAGGGAGGWMTAPYPSKTWYCYQGGRGADGLVYIEW